MRPPSTTQSMLAPARGDEAIRLWVESSGNRDRLYRRTLLAVLVSQVFGGAGLAAGITVGALLAKDMLGTDRYAGLPAAVFTLGSAGAALMVGRLSQRLGRRTGLTAGFVTGGIGALGVVLAAVSNNVALLFGALLIYGSGTATNLQARYAGTDLAKASQRGTAISIAMVSTTLGAVAGPNLVNAMGGVATSVGIPTLAGPFLLAAGAYLLAGGVLFVLLRPDPLMVAKAIASFEPPLITGESDTHDRIATNRGVVVGATVMVLTQMAMVAIMTMTPVYMRDYGFGLAEIGLVIGIHIGSMYLPSLVTGLLVDRIGRIPMAIASGVTLLAAGIVAAAAPPGSLTVLIIALTLLGLGWNLGLISGTALIVDATPLQSRAKTQGTVDVLIALAGASGGGISGMIVASFSFPALSLGGGVLALLLIPVVIWSRQPPSLQPKRV